MDETENNQFKPLREVSSNAVSTSGQSHRPICPPDVASRRSAILLGCYRKGDAEEPEIYAAAVASVLATYPQEIAYRVTDPRTGLAGRSQWLPTVAEVRAACEAEMAPTRAAEARLRRQAETEAVLTGPAASRVSAARWKDVSDRLESKVVRPSIAPKSEEWLKEQGHRPLGASDALRAQLAARAAE